MKKIVIIIFKIFLLTLMGSVIMKCLKYLLGSTSPILSALLAPILLGIVLYYLFFWKPNNKQDE
jgi:hypothetical protein